MNQLNNIVIHYVGNKTQEEGVIESASTALLQHELRDKIGDSLISLFKLESLCCFFLYFNINLNEVYIYVSMLFDNPERIIEISKYLVRHLYVRSDHPKIKGGEFYTAYFKDCIVDGEMVDAVGLFKSENKDTFLKVMRERDNFNLESEQGINIKKLDKGCLIFNKDRENGYVVAVVDNTNRGVDAQYWIDDFLHVRQRKDEYANTENVMAMAKQFITKELPKEFEVPKADQIDLLNRSLQFFKEKDTFDIEDFANEVIEQPEVIESFKSYKKNYEEEHATEIDDSFTISQHAFKKQQRSYKRIIRLDKKIQIIIDGNRDHIEQGEDEKGKYYKVYYSTEE